MHVSSARREEEPDEQFVKPAESRRGVERGCRDRASGMGTESRPGTLSGTVKDQQGGVVPGATVTVISQSQGTKSAPAVTNANGDFVIPNIAADTYTIRVEMPSFKTLNRTDVQVSPGSRVSIGTLTIDVGGTTETVNVTGESPVIQATTGERSFSITTETVDAICRWRAGATTRCSVSRPASRRRPA